MKEEKVEIKSLKIKMGKKDVEVTIEEARKLHEVLNQLFKVKVEEHHYHHHHDHYPYIPWYPVPQITWTISTGTYNAVDCDVLTNNNGNNCLLIDMDYNNGF